MTGMKAYLRSSKTVSQSTSAVNSSNMPPTFCMPDLVQKFRSGKFVTSFSAINNAWNDTNCTTEITPTVLGLIPYASRNFLTQWIANRMSRYKHFVNLLSAGCEVFEIDVSSHKKMLKQLLDGFGDRF
jgi:hypothetical protein